MSAALRFSYKATAIIAAVFVILGPPIGYLTLGMAVTVDEILSSSPTTFWGTFLLASPEAMPFAYIFGGVQAIFVGAAAAIASRLSKIRSFSFTLVAAFVASLIFVGLVLTILPPQTEEGLFSLFVIAAATHIVSAAVCWSIAFGFFAKVFS